MEENKDAVKFENLMKTIDKLEKENKELRKELERTDDIRKEAFTSINELLDVSIWDNATYDLERWYRI